MSSFARAAYHPPTDTVRQALYLDDYFGRHEYGVQFPGEEQVYRPQEVEIPQDRVFGLHIRNTRDDPPGEDQEVMYWFEPFGKWFFGRWDGEWHFYSRHGFCDGHDAPYWVDVQDLPQPPVTGHE